MKKAPPWETGAGPNKSRESGIDTFSTSTLLVYYLPATCQLNERVKLAL